MTLPSSRILLVDHSGNSLTYQETLLRRRQGILTLVSSGEEALTRIREERPTLVMFSFDLFDMTAPDLCRTVRNDEAIASTSMLLISSADKEAEIDLCMAAGCNDVILRPFTKRELEQKIARLTEIPVRRQLRTLTRIEVSLEKKGFFLLGHSLNLCATGMLLEADHVISAESLIRVHFYIPGDPSPLAFDAQIVRAEFSGSHRYGLQFQQVTDRDRERIEFFVKRVRSRELL
ncbi:MAG TPA: response regulator [Thermoanaerobaculia bacterium]|nr:response regulator [Thermoanaerobaculia bacterium]